MAGSGSKPGERRGGRKKGTPNKVTADIRALALKAAPAAMRELLRLAEHAESEAVRVTAIKELFDRGFGRPPQAITGADGGPIETRSDIDLARSLAFILEGMVRRKRGIEGDERLGQV